MTPQTLAFGGREFPVLWTMGRDEAGVPTFAVPFENGWCGLVMRYDEACQECGSEGIVRPDGLEFDAMLVERSEADRLLAEKPARDHSIIIDTAADFYHLSTEEAVLMLVVWSQWPSPGSPPGWVPIVL